MKCPLITEPTRYPDKQVSLEPIDCLREKCAWWDTPKAWCIIKAIDMELVLLVGELKELVKKMPHKG